MIAYLMKVRERVTLLLRRLGLRIWKYLQDSGADLLALLAVVAGWLLITVAVYMEVPRLSIWPVSIGLLILGLAGFRFVGGLLWNGLYLPVVEEDE